MNTALASPVSPQLTSKLSPNEQAQKLIGRDYISFSAMSTFQQCPLKFYFKYIEKLPEHTVSASLVFGGAMHAAVEHHFRSLLEGVRHRMWPRCWMCIDRRGRVVAWPPSNSGKAAPQIC